jgi:NAD(P)-dependent dehydrogenase (short-subunit alcohol dehydrogenase family)
MQTLLDNKVIIITGASSGIGAAAALTFAKAGARLVIGARSADGLRSVADQIGQAGGVAIAVPGNVTDPSYALKMVEIVKREFGGLDGALNNAGAMGAGVAVADTSTEDWDKVLATNLTANFHAAKAQIPAMRERGGGSIVFTGSFIGYSATLPGMGAYAASKAALIGLAQAIAVECGTDRIRANVLMPGGTLTSLVPDALTNPQTRSFIEGLHALKRMAEPDEIANAALFLISDMSSFVTGSALLADGGNSISKV